MTIGKPIIRGIIAGVIVTVVATAAGMWAAQQILHREQAVDELAATRFPVAREIGPFELIDHNSTPFNNAALKQGWSFLFFGYTHCPDVCPTTLSVLNSVAQRLEGITAEVKFVLVSVDQERDTPEQLANYVTYFNGDFIGVTGTPAGLEQLTTQLGILYIQTEPDAGSEGYLVDHTAGVFLFDPDGRYHAVFTPPLSAEVIAGDFKKMLRDYQ